MRNFEYNYILVAAFLSWGVAQIIKTFINTIIKGKFNPERLFGAGGMPSSHSALVMSTLVAVGRLEGVNSTAFSIAFILAAVTIYDAMGVRRAVGEHAKFINFYMFGRKTSDIEEEKKPLTPSFIDRKKLKEYIGHTPLEVFFGSLLGIIIAVALPTSL